MTDFYFWLKTSLIILSCAFSMSLFYHLSYFYEKNTPLNFVENKNNHRQRKIFTVILSIPAVFVWGILVQSQVKNLLTPILRGIVLALVCSFIFVVVELFILKIMQKKDQDNAFDFIPYVVHNVLAMPVLWTFSHFFANRIKLVNSDNGGFIIIAILAGYYLLFFIVNEVLFNFQKKVKAPVKDYIPVNNLNVNGEYLLKSGDYIEKYISIIKKNNTLYISLKDEDLKIKGYENQGQIFADLSGELPRLELYHTKNKNFTGILTLKSENRLTVFPVTAYKQAIIQT